MELLYTHVAPSMAASSSLSPTQGRVGSAKNFSALARERDKFASLTVNLGNLRNQRESSASPSSEVKRGINMRYLALATDYDGTLATQGQVQPEVLEALKKLRQSGRKLLLVTGREMKDLFRVFPEYEVFDLIVAENGAVLYDPSSNQERVLTEPPSETLVAALKALNVEPISVGRSIIATWEPHENAVLKAIKELGLELEMIFNKGAIMILPSGINKSTGLQAALNSLDIPLEACVGVGDAENDHAFLKACGFSVAVRNAIPSLKDTATMVTESERGHGVIELINEMLANDLTIDVTAGRIAKLA